MELFIDVTFTLNNLYGAYQKAVTASFTTCCLLEEPSMFI